MDYNLIFEKMAHKYKKRIVRYFADKDIGLSCVDLERYSAILAAWLQKKGIKKGDRIGIWMGNVPEFLLFFAAGLRLGAVLVPVNVYVTIQELERICMESNCRLLIVDFNNPKIYKRTGGKISVTGTECIGLTADHTNKNSIRIPYGVQKEEIEEHTFRCDIGVGDDIVINFTSGSTGDHKGIRKSIRSFFGKEGFPDIFNRMFDLLRIANMESVFNICPWYHTTGIYFVMILMSGGVFTEITIENFNPSEVVDYLEQYSPKIWIGTATMLYRCCIVECDRNQKIRVPEVTLSAGEALSKHIIETLGKQMNSGILISIYGLTEAGIISSAVYQFHKLPLYLRMVLFYMRHKNWIGDIQTEQDFLNQRDGQFLGIIKKTIQVDIFDINTKEKLQDGQQGEICVCTTMYPNGFAKKNESNLFLKNDNKTYVRTGDFGYMRGKHLYLTGRIKNLIIRSGENIIPEDIERRIEGYQGISDVVVCGVPDLKYGEEICACLEIGEGNIELDDLKEKLQKELPKYMIPKWFLLFDKFPVNASNKKDIKRIREEAQNRVEVLADSKK